MQYFKLFYNFSSQKPYLAVLSRIKPQLSFFARAHAKFNKEATADSLPALQIVCASIKLFSVVFPVIMTFN